MDSRSDQDLLREYSERDSESAFAELMRRHVDFLFSAALRMTGERHLAEDVTQCVFVLLARNASTLDGHPVLSGWLHRTTRNVAAKMVRTEVRRRAREQEAVKMIDPNKSNAGWDTIASSLDAALEDLKEPERQALFLRFFERKSAHQIATVMGTTEEAAQKRVSRALDRLRDIFDARGVTISAGALATAIAANSVEAAPVTLVANISGTLFGGSVLGTSLTAATKVITMTTLQKSVIAVVIIASAATAVFEGVRAKQFAQTAEFARQHEILSSNQLQQITQERDDALERLGALREQKNNTTAQSADTSRLRAEVAMLRDQLQRQKTVSNSDDPTLAAAKVLADRVRILHDQFNRWQGKSTPELQLLSQDDWFQEALKHQVDSDTACREAMAELRTQAKSRFADAVKDALENFAKANNDQLPTDLSQLAPYLNPPADACLVGYEIAPPGAVKPPQPNSPNANRAETWAMVEKGSLRADGSQTGADSVLSDPDNDMYVVIYRGGHYGYGPPRVARK